MRPDHWIKTAIAAMFVLLGVFSIPTYSLAANGGSVSAYFGTDTTTTISGDKDTATASGNGTGGAVTYYGNNLTNGTTPGWTTSSDQERNVVVTPASGYQIVWVKVWRKGQSWNDENVDNPATGATSFQLKIKSGRAYKVAVLFEPVAVNYNVSYTIAADNPVGTNCNTTAIVAPTSPQSVVANSNPSFTITNSNAACQLDSVNFDSTGFSTAGIVGNTYTTPDITKNVSFQIRFRGSSYTITSTVDATGTAGCGTISPGTQSYISGSTQMFTMVKNINCAIQSVLVDGTDVTAAVTAASNKYTFSNILANHTITVKYVATSTTTGSSYCQVPPFMKGQNALKPNVLLVFDASGSMGENPYSGKTYDCTETGTKSVLTACTNFYGYFEPGKMYKLKSGSTSDYLIDTATTLNLASATGTGIGKGLSGNYLNYKNMRKVDIIRKILVGGQVDTSTGGSARGAATGGTNTRWLVTDNNRRVEFGTVDPTGLIHAVFDKVRFGMMVFNDNGSNIGSGDGGRVSAPFGSTLATLVAQIEGSDTDPGGYTPLAETLYEAMRYYRGTTSAYNSGVDYGNTTNYPVESPFSRHAIQASCQKNFVLVLTDGEPTNDGNIPGSAGSNITDTNFSTWVAAMGTPAPTAPMAKVAYYMHIKDMLDLTKVSADLTKLNNINVFTVFAFDSAANGVTTLQQAAKFGSFVEATASFNGKPDLTSEWSPDNGATYNNYYQADDGAVLEDNIASALSKIISSTASGTAAAVANNKSGERGANMIQALFFPQWPYDGNIKWLGEVQAIWYYLDPMISYSGIFEDTNGDKELNLASDRMPTVDSFSLKTLWRAGASLQQTLASNRNIYTLLNSSSALTDSANAFTTTNVTTLKPLMNLSSLLDSQAGIVLNYVRGVDDSVYRPRLVNFTDPNTGTVTSGVWKLGDIINSTPQVESSVALNGYTTVYLDSSYTKFTKSADYSLRNVVFTGSNDGLFHAFKLGTVTKIFDAAQPFRVARMTGTDLGKEQWAFIPKNALPYLQNQCGSDYCHQYLVDGAPILFDASFNKNSDCSATNYWDCERKTTVTSTNALDLTRTSWRTLVISGMGLGGASRDAASNCNETYAPDTVASNNADCVKTPLTGIGLSSYFALDVTDPLSPKHLWEFSDYSISDAADKGLGFTTAGAAIVKINAVDTAAKRIDKTKNGRWFAVFASGPTGAIDPGNKLFTGHSDQNLKLYIIDLNGGSTLTKCVSAGQTNCNYWVKDTGIKFAFANSITGATSDLDKWNKSNDGNYSDDIIYVSFTKATLTNHAANPAGDFPASANAWDKGGIVRLVTNHDPDPSNWFTSILVDDIGPVTTSISVTQDLSAKKLWVNFGEGRFFHPQDELSTPRKIYGIADPCYKQYIDSSNTPGTPLYTGDTFANYSLGTTAAKCPAISTGDLQNQSSDTPSATLSSGMVGWYINLTIPSGTAGAERVVSDAVSGSGGAIFFTTFIPNTDVCVPGGKTSLWAVKYNTGTAPPASSLQGKAPIQTSSGGINLLDLSTSFTDRGGRTMPPIKQLEGEASKTGFKPLMPAPPVKKILNIRER